MSVALQSDEVPEKSYQISLRDANARVTHLHVELSHLVRIQHATICIESLSVFDSWFLEPAGDSDLAVLCEFHRVRKQVHANLLDTLLITEDMALGHVDYDFGLLACGLHLDDAHNLDNGLLHFHVHVLRLECPTLDLSVVKRVIHIIEHLNRAELNDLDVLALDWVFFSGQQEISEVNGGREGCAHFVGHVGAVHRRQSVLSFQLL